jgi:hypothetical protein
MASAARPSQRKYPDDLNLSASRDLRDRFLD